MKKRMSLEIKLAIREELNKEMTYQQIAERLGITPRVARKWGQVIKRGGNLEPRMGRPRVGCLGSFASSISEAIDKLRPGKEGWGPIPIELELREQEALAGQRLPRARSIGSYLKAKQRVKTPRLVQELPTEPVVVPRQAHDVWQMDAEGNKRVSGIGTVSFINIGDTFSKAYVGSYPCRLAGNFNHPTRHDYQFALRLALCEYGRCNHLQLDHESVFYDNSNFTPYPTSMHLWAIGLGIEVFFTPKGKPQKQGLTERKHQTLHRQICADRTFDSYEELFAFCQQRRDRLNRVLPCRSLYGRPPFIVFPEATAAPRTYQIEQEEELFDLKRIYHFLADQYWIRAFTANQSFSLGKFSYYIKEATPNSSVRITFNPQTLRFDCWDANSKFIASIAPKGLSFKELAGRWQESIQWRKEHAQIIFPPDTTFLHRVDTT